MWSLFWTQHLVLARELTHEVLTRRDASAAPAAQVIAVRLQAQALELGARFGGGYAGEAFEAGVRALAVEYAAFVEANAKQVGALERLAAYEAAGVQVAAAMAERARRLGLDEKFADAASMHALIVQPLVALMIQAVVDYHAKRYASSLNAFEAALAHTLEVLAPACTMIIEPASSTKLAAVQMIRRVHNG